MDFSKSISSTDTMKPYTCKHSPWTLQAYGLPVISSKERLQKQIWRKCFKKKNIYLDK